MGKALLGAGWPQSPAASHLLINGEHQLPRNGGMFASLPENMEFWKGSEIRQK